MYSQQELDDAVASGVITADAANALRAHVAGQHASTIPDEEQFRLITGFNDIFVSIAAAILLFAVGWIGQSIGQSLGLAVGGDGPSFLAPLGVAATSWGLALFFTAKRRMALPSIVLLLSFVVGVFATAGIGLATVIGDDRLNNNNLLAGVLVSASGAIAAAAAWFHWRRFRVPITVAAGAAAVASIAVGILLSALGQDVENAKNIILGLVLALGIGIFLFAMWWDGSDRERLTCQSCRSATRIHPTSSNRDRCTDLKFASDGWQRRAATARSAASRVDSKQPSAAQPVHRPAREQAGTKGHAGVRRATNATVR